jgi:hypothetical protein
MEMGLPSAMKGAAIKSRRATVGHVQLKLLRVLYGSLQDHLEPCVNLDMFSKPIQSHIDMEGLEVREEHLSGFILSSWSIFQNQHYYWGGGKASTMEVHSSSLLCLGKPNNYPLICLLYPILQLQN